MTIKNAAEFMKKLFEDEKLRAEVEAALKGGGEPLAIAGRVAVVGKTHGFEFAPKEILVLQAALHDATTRARAQAEGQLSDDELAKVSGGRTELDTMIDKMMMNKTPEEMALDMAKFQSMVNQRNAGFELLTDLLDKCRTTVDGIIKNMR